MIGFRIRLVELSAELQRIRYELSPLKDNPGFCFYQKCSSFPYGEEYRPFGNMPVGHVIRA